MSILDPNFHPIENLDFKYFAKYLVYPLNTYNNTLMFITANNRFEIYSTLDQLSFIVNDKSDDTYYGIIYTKNMLPTNQIIESSVVDTLI
jgi:hypothetical protein